MPKWDEICKHILAEEALHLYTFSQHFNVSGKSGMHANALLACPLCSCFRWTGCSEIAPAGVANRAPYTEVSFKSSPIMIRLFFINFEAVRFQVRSQSRQSAFINWYLGSWCKDKHKQFNRPDILGRIQRDVVWLLDYFRLGWVRLGLIRLSLECLSNVIELVKSVQDSIKYRCWREHK